MQNLPPISTAGATTYILWPIITNYLVAAGFVVTLAEDRTAEFIAILERELAGLGTTPLPPAEQAALPKAGRAKFTVRVRVSSVGAFLSRKTRTICLANPVFHQGCAERVVADGDIEFAIRNRKGERCAPLNQLCQLIHKTTVAGIDGNLLGVIEFFAG